MSSMSIINVTAKSFIAFIGANVGRLHNAAISHNSIAGAARAFELGLLARATDSKFNENPSNDKKDKKYRLLSSVTFEISCVNSRITEVNQRVDTDTGMEGSFQPPPLIMTPVTVSATGGPTVTFSWRGKGCPHPTVEPIFQAIQLRTSVFIWHEVSGTISLANGPPTIAASIKGSQFPSHRLFIDNKQVYNDTQGPFSNLWTSRPGSPSEVA